MASAVNADAGSGKKAWAENWTEIAEKLLASRDFVGSKHFAERAIESCPNVSGAEEILAVANVLLSFSSSPWDHYAVLQLPLGASSPEVERSYRRLSVLLDPSRNRRPGADSALKLVSEAYAVLSKPTSDPISTAATANNDPSAFWTGCPLCFHVHQFVRNYQNRRLRCPNSNCRRPFTASELAVPPPIVPGTDLYYCAWAFFPLGFPNAADVNNEWKPFQPMFPWQEKSPTKGNDNASGGGGDAGDLIYEEPGTKRKKSVVRKKVITSGPRKNFPSSGESSGEIREPMEAAASEPQEGNASSSGWREININEEIPGPESDIRVDDKAGGAFDLGSFHLDVDATVDILGNLQSLPFLRDDVVPGRMM